MCLLLHATMFQNEYFCSMKKVFSWFSVDLAGTFMSALCVVHCLALPFFLSFGSAFFHGWVEWLFLLSAIFFTISSAYQSWKRHSLSFYGAGFFAIGIALLVASLLSHIHMLSILGGLALIAGHLLQWRTQQA